MRLTNLITALLPAVGLCAPWGPPHGPPQAKKSAIYFLRVDPKGSSVVAVDVGSNGMLANGSSSTSTTSTEGVGLQSINVTAPGDPVTGIDPLQGQQAVSIADDYLFTINSGSNTVVMFKINPENPLELSMVGKPAATLGEFAMSVTYSSRHKKACVLNGGAVNGLSCFNVDPSKGLTADGVGLREFGVESTTPPHFGGPKASGSDVQFSTDESKVIATFKGTTMPMTHGHIFVFSVSEQGDVEKSGVDNQMSPLSAAFGFSVDPRNKQSIFVSDAGFGGGVLAEIDYDTNKASVKSVVNNTEFAATCWAVYCAETDLFYTIDAGTPNIGKVNSESGQLESIISYDKKLGGATDTVVNGAMAYSLTAVNTIAVFNLQSGQVLQEYNYGTASDRPTWTGMAMYPAMFSFRGGWW